MSHEHILVIEDEEDIQELIRYNLSKEGFRIDTALSGEDGLKKLKNDPVDIVLLDLMLPGIDGLDVCRALKKNEKLKSIPVIMLTAKGEESDIVTGLELGADDYMVKPFSPKILAARIRAVLRRKSAGPLDKSQPLEVNDLAIHPGRREVLFRGRPIELTNMEFQLVYLLASRPGWVFSRNQIVEGTRGAEYSVTDRAVDVLIVGLRRKLGEAGVYIETVRGVGYKFLSDTPPPE
jgi:two-component system, OmpR family, alkaline phosphatase synthesis response regulator PhoP